MVEANQISLSSEKCNYRVSIDTVFDSGFLIFRMVCIFRINLEVDKFFRECNNFFIRKRIGIQPFTPTSPFGVEVHHDWFARFFGFRQPCLN